MICENREKMISAENYQKVVHKRTLFNKSETIYSDLNGKSAQYRLDKGCVKLGSTAIDGSIVFFDILLPGEYFGKVNNEFNPTEFAVCHIDSEITEFKQNASGQIEQKHEYPEETLGIHKSLTRFKNRIINLSHSNAESRLSYICKLFDIEISDYHGEKYNLLSTLSIKEIASFSGVTRQSASKFLKPILMNKHIGLKKRV